ncbi:hypothetical protein [Arthrobacter sp. A2-55]|uniref:hypothetical protein n=1 Tax=Arthrobacter sp. A2-55 TaxID=2897337 RepID=UPI0021CD3130|nr:hypothetical protein [Arthrobacter sp. A2-55]MCU6480537.1 hypothetical protein [Arthrobacter sp. A2-55]
MGNVVTTVAVRVWPSVKVCVNEYDTLQVPMHIESVTASGDAVVVPIVGLTRG